MKKLLEENNTLTQIVNNAGQPSGFHQLIIMHYMLIQTGSTKS